MKSNRILMQFGLCLVTLLSVHQFVMADRGGSSGSGNQGDGFSIASLRQSRPGLSALEVLLEAFDQSKGRIPGVIDQLAQKRVASFGSDGLEISLARGIAFNTSNPYLEARHIINYGPKFHNALEAKDLLLSINGSTVDLHVGRIEKTADSLVLYTPDNEPFMELRQVNDDEIVYIRHRLKRVGIVNGVCSVGVSATDTNTIRPEVCSVGYFWKRNK